jgi:hypothetical protein
LNPFDFPWVVKLAAFVNSLIVWIFAAGLYYENITCLFRAMGILASARQATSSNQSILGTNLNLGTALAMALIITTVMLAVPLFANGWFNNHTFSGMTFHSLIISNPFKGMTAGGVSDALWITCQFFPLSFMFYCVVARIFFQVSLGAIVWTVTTIVRFLVG